MRAACIKITVIKRQRQINQNKISQKGLDLI